MYPAKILPCLIYFAREHLPPLGLIENLVSYINQFLSFTAQPVWAELACVFNSCQKLSGITEASNIYTHLYNVSCSICKHVLNMHTHIHTQICMHTHTHTCIHTHTRTHARAHTHTHTHMRTHTCTLYLYSRYSNLSNHQQKQ